MIDSIKFNIAEIVGCNQPCWIQKNNKWYNDNVAFYTSYSFINVDLETRDVITKTDDGKFVWLRREWRTYSHNPIPLNESELEKMSFILLGAENVAM